MAGHDGRYAGFRHAAHPHFSADLQPRQQVRDSDALLLKAAEMKALYSLSLADAWIAACALEQGATLIHKDPEFHALPLEQEALPLKTRRLSAK